MKCHKCGAEFQGKFCSECGEPAPASSPKFCTNCGKELTPGKTFCGFCGTALQADTQEKPSFQQLTPASSNKKNGCLKKILIAFAVVVALGVLGIILGEDEEDLPAESSDPVSSSYTSEVETSKSETESVKTSTVEENIPIEYTTGDTAIENDVSVTLLNVEQTYGTEFFYPEEENVFVVFDFELENSTKEEITFSYFYATDAYCDDYAIETSFNGDAATKKNALSGTLAPGKKLNGSLVYEVPEEWNKIEIVFDWTLVSNRMDDVIFVVENK